MVRLRAGVRARAREPAPARAPALVLVRARARIHARARACIRLALGTPNKFRVFELSVHAIITPNKFSFKKFVG